MSRSANSTISPIENFDPLARFLRNQLCFRPFTYGLFIFIADLIVDGAIGLQFDAFISGTATPGILQDYMALVVDFVFNPVIAGLYLWATEGTTKLFDQLQDSKIFLSDMVVKNIVDSRRRLYRHPAPFVIITLGALVFTITQIQ